jgi:predicted RNA binding protein YcfA (HicA-like mRNA interferase family)
MHTGKELLRILKREGFKEISCKGSHRKLRNNEGKTVILPYSNSQYPKNTYYDILKDAGLKGKV